jgi:hypothetical protein
MMNKMMCQIVTHQLTPWVVTRIAAKAHGQNNSHVPISRSARASLK